MRCRPSSAARLALVFALGLTACARRTPPAEPPPPTPPPTPEQVVRAGEAVLEQYRQSLEIESFEALSALYVRDLDTVAIVQGKPHRGWSAVEAHKRSFFDRASDIHARVSDVSVTALGDAGAHVVATLSREYKAGPATITETGLLTLTLVRVADDWLIVGEHFSYALSP